ncbi:MAG: hypothetical protein PHD12_06840 [Methylotenera sp.]|nr:hypothetical protein [Methylotenera sp.]
MNLLTPIMANWLKLSTALLMSLLVVLFVTPAQAAPEDNFGRLFSTQAERRNLDVLRQNQQLKVISPQDIQPEISESVAPVNLPEPVTMQGFVKRSDGASTLWINNQAVQENTQVDEVQIGRLNQRAGGVGAESLNIKIPANGKQVQLKPGQIYEPEANQIKELKLQAKEKQLRLEETGVIGSETAP